MPDYPNGERREDFYCTTAEAAALLRRAARERARVYVWAGGDAPVPSEPGSVYRGCLRTPLRVSHSAARRVAGGMLSNTLEARGARIPFSRTEDSSHIRYYFG